MQLVHDWRRSLLTFALCYLAWSLTAPIAGGTELRDAIKKLVDAHAGDVAVAVKHLGTGESFEYQADKAMPTASLIKFPVMIEAFRQEKEGMVDFDKLIELKATDKVPGSGVLSNHFSDGVQIRLRDAIRLMIVFSDNTATNLVLDEIGLAATARSMATLDCPNTKIHAKVFRRDTSIFPDRSRQFGLGSTTASEMMSLLERLYSGALVSESACQEMLQHLYACEDRTKIARLLPPGTKLAHKSGAVSKSRTDAGLIESPGGTIAICVLTNENEDRRWDDDNAANVLCGAIGKAVYHYFHSNVETSPEAKSLAIGAMSRLVESLQRTLNERLIPSPDLSIDGDFGPATEAAVKRFQKQSSLPTTGIVDDEMWKALGPLVTKGPEVPPPDVINNELLPTEPADDLVGLPYVSCKSWVIVDASTAHRIAGYNDNEPLDPASTTKIMTAFVVLELAQQHPAVLDEIVTFSVHADSTPGSTSSLRAGEQVTVRELLYGLLLPSGNDASVALAQHFGQRFTDAEVDRNGAYTAFVEKMNETAKRIGMRNSSFVNTHGLTAEGHLLTAQDLAVLAHESMKVPPFRAIVATRQFGCVARSQAGYSRNVLWKNTNRLLRTRGYNGVKTGTTQAAGACLVSHGTRGDQSIIVVVLGAPSTSARYADTRNLFRWAWNALAK